MKTVKFSSSRTIRAHMASMVTQDWYPTGYGYEGNDFTITYCHVEEWKYKQMKHFLGEALRDVEAL